MSEKHRLTPEALEKAVKAVDGGRMNSAVRNVILALVNGDSRVTMTTRRCRHCANYLSYEIFPGDEQYGSYGGYVHRDGSGVCSDSRGWHFNSATPEGED